MTGPARRTGRTRLTCLTGRSRVAVAAAVLLLLVGAAPRLARSAGAQDRLVVGLKAFQDGFHDLAAKELRAFLAAAPQDSRRPDVLYVLAQAELARGERSGARKVLEELAAAPGPRAAEAQYWLGWLATQEAKPAEALERLDRYLGAGGGERRTDALFLAGEAALSLGRGPAAADRFSRFLEAASGDPRRPAAWAGLVQAQAGAEPASARDAARRALAAPEVQADQAAVEAVALAGVESARGAKDPASEAAFWAALATAARDGALRQRARHEEGAALARSGDVAGAQKTLQASLLAAPKGPYAGAAHLLLAELAEHPATGSGDRAAALGHLEAALALPGDPAVKPRRRELRRAALGLALSVGDRDRAAAHARELLADEKSLTAEDRALVRLTLGSAAGSAEEAVGHWDAVPPGAARYREARLLAARALLEAGRPGEALARVEPILAGEDPGAEAHLTALAAAEAAGDHRRAAEVAGRLAERPPTGGTGSEFLQRRALALQKAGDDGAYAQALERLASGPAGEPGVGWAGAELGSRAFARGEWEAVLRWAAVARAGSDPATRTALAFPEAEALFRLGRLEAARAAFAALAAREGPVQAPALARLGAILDQAADREGAAEAYRGALAAGLGGEAAQWVRSRLSALGGGPEETPE